MSGARSFGVALVVTVLLRCGGHRRCVPHAIRRGQLQLRRADTDLVHHT